MVRQTDRPDMSIVVKWNVKHQTKAKNNVVSVNITLEWDTH